MQSRFSRSLLAVWLLVAALVLGCATSSKSRRSGQPQMSEASRAAETAQPTVAPALEQALKPTRGEVRPVSFVHDTTGETQQPASPSDRPQNPTGPAPAEIVAAPTAQPLEQGLQDGRPTLPLDLMTALSLTQGQNPRVAFAQAQIAQSLAVHQQARLLWLPSLRAGGNYNKHEGAIQQVEGQNILASRGAAFGGLGAYALGAGSPSIPGVYALVNTSDAIFQRRITEFALEAREYQATAVTNDQLLDTALAYLTLLDAWQRKAIADETLQHGEQLAELTANFAKAGAGSLADADRASAALAQLRSEAIRAEEAVAVASARLAQQLSLDPTLQIVPQEAAIVPIDLVTLGTADAELVATGLTNRPELAASRSLVCEAVNRLRREEHAPWLPSLLLGMSYGQFGAGTGGQITNGANRFDFDGVAWWEVRNLGFGEKAARDNARAQIQQARMREVETMDQVAREIVEAHVQSLARQRQIAVAEQGITAAQQSYERNLERIRNAQGLPLEVLQSIQALDAARREYLRAVVDYDTAQFRLHRALGWPVAI
jgi:outer membrane protein TolC